MDALSQACGSGTKALWMLCCRRREWGAAAKGCEATTDKEQRVNASKVVREDVRDARRAPGGVVRVQWREVVRASGRTGVVCSAEAKDGCWRDK